MIVLLNDTPSGVAIYFLSPLWPYLVNTAVSLDNGPIALVDLVDHSRPQDPNQGPETVQSTAVWGASGLANTQHTLVVSVGAGQPFGIVDAFMCVLLYLVIQFLTPLAGTPSSIPRIQASPPVPPQLRPHPRQLPLQAGS
ncbi:hypothetical protein BDQ12DRAFT_691300 [Crucibulum laeve]|uniref:Uncharacterized protein n=1 Tax=Crucibulum laeve TaxID=68775 RepID=A0A5C3LKT4_9AGAR|nr:hypothetical protein BDQ12DRAFT_691300 [Crucibulum laeve]